MDELVIRISEKIGVTQEQARKAVLIIADHLKSKLPDPIYEEIQMVMDLPEATDEETRELGLFTIP